MCLAVKNADRADSASRIMTGESGTANPPDTAVGVVCAPGHVRRHRNTAVGACVIQAGDGATGIGR